MSQAALARARSSRRRALAFFLAALIPAALGVGALELSSVGLWYLDGTAGVVSFLGVLFVLLFATLMLGRSAAGHLGDAHGCELAVQDARVHARSASAHK